MKPRNHFPGMIESHKGVATDAPENTMAAFRLAEVQGYDMIELDPAFTLDHVCVIHHDWVIGGTDRYPDGSEIPESEQKELAAMTFREVRALDAGIWFDQRFAGEKIPTLEEVLAFSKASGIPLKLDNKMEGFAPEDFKLMCDEIRALKMDSAIGFTGFHLDFIERVVKEFPAATIHYDGFVTAEALAALQKVLKDNPLFVWMRYDNELTSWCETLPIQKNLVDLAHRYGKVGAWIIADPKQALDAVQNFGVDIVETNGAIKPDAFKTMSF